MGGSVEQSARSFPPGTVLAEKFRITGVLGEGGMAIVLAAHHEALDMPVALKVMRIEAAAKPEVRARFAREARAVAALRSEHVARVLDVGETDDGRPFIVIEHLTGMDLAQLLAAEGRQPIARAVDLALQACVGLSEAHARGITHRDVKPANLFLTHHGGAELVKLLDFGISKMAVDLSAPNPVITGTELMGSPAYMSPEQLRASSRVDGRSDVWSLGAVLYELLAGDPPFGGGREDFYSVVSAILEDGIPALRAKRPDVPEELERVVLRALDKDQERRIATPDELARDLAPFGGPGALGFAARAGAAASHPPPAPSSNALPAADPSAATLLGQPPLAVPGPTSRTSALRPSSIGKTRCASGDSTAADTVKAVRDAFHRAEGSLGGQRATLAFLFASPRHDLGRAAEELGLLTGGAAVVSCTTAGELTERGLIKSGLVVLLVASNALTSHVTFADALASGASEAAARLCEGFEETRLAARQAGHGQSTTVVLLDGLSGVGEEVVEGILQNTRGYQRVVGGAAADDGAFAVTRVATKERTAKASAVAAHVFTPQPWGIGVAHGLEPASGRMRVTRARGNRIYEIERRPAFEVYRDYARQKLGHDLTPDRAGPFLVANELGIYYFDAIRHARSGLRVERDGSIVCAGAVPEGASVCILRGEPEALLAAARRAAEEALEQLGGRQPSGVLVFDCVCRASILGARFDAEIRAIADVFPDVPIAGFLTYGEIARARGRLEGWHNATVVVVAIA